MAGFRPIAGVLASVLLGTDGLGLSLDSPPRFPLLTEGINSRHLRGEGELVLST